MTSDNTPKHALRPGFLSTFALTGASLVAQTVKNPPANAGDTRDEGSTPGSGRSPREGNGNSLQCPCLENSMDRGVYMGYSP